MDNSAGANTLSDRKICWPCHKLNTGSSIVQHVHYSLRVHSHVSSNAYGLRMVTNKFFMKKRSISIENALMNVVTSN